MEWLAIIRTEQFNLFIVHESIRTNRPTPGYNDNQSKRMEMPWSLLLMRPWDISIQHICQDYRHLLIPGPRVLAINQWEQKRVILKQQMVIRLTNDIWHREQRTDGQWIKLLPEQQWNWTHLDNMEQKPIMISWLQWNNGFPVKTDSVRTWSANHLSRNVIWNDRKYKNDWQIANRGLRISFGI